MALGTRVDWKWLELGVVYAHQHNGDVAYVPVKTVPDQFTPVVFDAHGFEVFARAGLGRFGLIGGYTMQDPEDPGPVVESQLQNPLLHPGSRVVLRQER